MGPSKPSKPSKLLGGPGPDLVCAGRMVGHTCHVLGAQHLRKILRIYRNVLKVGGCTGGSVTRIPRISLDFLGFS